MNIEHTLKERGSRYGNFTDHANITQHLKQAMYKMPKYGSLEPYMAEALEMIAHKIGRILNGDPYYKDSWTDIIGYARLVEQELEKLEQEDDIRTYDTGVVTDYVVERPRETPIPLPVDSADV